MMPKPPTKLSLFATDTSKCPSVATRLRLCESKTRLFEHRLIKATNAETIVNISVQHDHSSVTLSNQFTNLSASSMTRNLMRFSCRDFVLLMWSTSRPGVDTRMLMPRRNLQHACALQSVTRSTIHIKCYNNNNNNNNKHICNAT